LDALKDRLVWTGRKQKTETRTLLRNQNSLDPQKRERKDPKNAKGKGRERTLSLLFR